MSSLLEGRLGAFARVQAAVTRDPTKGVSLRSLIDDEIAAVDVPDGHVMTIYGPDVHLTPRTAESISLAIHELATNAIKHGALAVQRGRLSVHWRRDMQKGREWLTLEWVESGLPAKPTPRRDGFGMSCCGANCPMTRAARRRSTSDPMVSVSASQCRSRPGKRARPDPHGFRPV